MKEKPGMIIDAYNLMHADGDIKALMEQDLEAAREMLIAMLTDYCAAEDRRVDLVFDAGGRPGAATSENRTEALRIVYTASGESADDYIESLIYQARAPFASTIVVTGDYAQQRIAQGAGVVRMSPREFLSVLRESREDLRREIAPAPGGKRRRARLSDRLPEDTVAALERLRRQQKSK